MVRIIERNIPVVCDVKQHGGCIYTCVILVDRPILGARTFKMRQQCRTANYITVETDKNECDNDNVMLGDV
jgi:hypothetical protein